MTPEASVIVPTRNRPDELTKCLECLARQTAPQGSFEVLVVDGGSTDRAAEVVRRFADDLRLVYEVVSEPGLHNARHEGMKLASSDRLLFCDDDTRAESGWVAAIVETMGLPNVALVGGNNYPLFEEQPPPWLLHWWKRRRYNGSAIAELSILDFGEGVFDLDPAYIWGCNFSVWRDVLLGAGGFHPDAVPADHLRLRGDGETHVSEMVRRSGSRSIFNSRASVAHCVSKKRMTRSYFEQRSYAQGISDSYTEIRRTGGQESSLRASTRGRIARSRATLGLEVRLAVAIHDRVEREMRSIQRACAGAYWRGYDFH